MQLQIRDLLVVKDKLFTILIVFLSLQYTTMHENAQQYDIFGTGKKKIANVRIELYNPIDRKTETKEVLDFMIDKSFTIFFFYPDDFSYVCPTELKKLNQYYKTFKKLDTEVIVISRDSVYSHRKWIEIDPELHDFGINMISDRDGDLLQSLDLFQKGKSFQRITIITSNTGKVLHTSIYPQNIGRNIDELIRIIHAMHHVMENPNKLCPENRDIDKEALTGEINDTKSNSIFK